MLMKPHGMYAQSKGEGERGAADDDEHLRLKSGIQQCVLYRAYGIGRGRFKRTMLIVARFAKRIDQPRELDAAHKAEYAAADQEEHRS